MREVLAIPAKLQGQVWWHSATPAGAIRPTPIHHHRELELNLIVRGTGTYLIDDRRYDLTPHMQLWLFPAQEHLLISRSADFQMWIAVFRPALLQQVCRERGTHILRRLWPNFEFCRWLTPRRAQGLGALFAQLAEITDHATQFNTGLGFALLSAWAASVEAEQGAQGRLIHPAVERTAKLIHDNPRGLKLESLAQEVGLSPSRLSRLFRRQMGLTLVAYRQNRCLERLFDILAESHDAKLIDAAHRAGFGSYPQFHRVFRWVMGCTPGTYRKHQRASMPALSYSGLVR